MAATVARHETRALLRAHLAAASGYRHRTRHCPICHRLLLLALQPERAPGSAAERTPERAAGREPVRPPESVPEERSPARPQADSPACFPAQDESPPDP
ncbi:DUF6274 family protein [Streptomyces sp. NPDC054863]